MNREIEFRGKRVETGEWVYGYFFQDENGNCFIRGDKSTEIGYLTYSVIPETVGQYTEIKNKNGNKIYEEDIILSEYGTGRVYFCGTTCQFKIEFSLDSDLLWLHASDIFILGNIFENPELLNH